MKMYLRAQFLFLMLAATAASAQTSSPSSVCIAEIGCNQGGRCVAKLDGAINNCVAGKFYELSPSQFELIRSKPNGKFRAQCWTRPDEQDAQAELRRLILINNGECQ